MDQKTTFAVIPFRRKEKTTFTEKILTPSPDHSDCILVFTGTFMLLLVLEVYFLTGSFWKWAALFFGDMFVSVIITAFFVGILHDRTKSRSNEHAKSASSKVVMSDRAKELVEIFKEKDTVLAS
jgi:hypothetical protein